VISLFNRRPNGSNGIVETRNSTFYFKTLSIVKLCRLLGLPAILSDL